jgi:Flp pilus assembly protein CpaB
MRWSHKLVMLSISALLLSCSVISPYGNLPADLIPPGLRAVNILVDEDISLAPGDRVNVLMIDKTQTNVTALENVAVMAADQKLGIVTLVVSPEDAQRIADAGEQGQSSLRLWKSY